MKTDKTKLLQDIEAMKAKLASMEEELNKPEEFKHFPNKGEVYYFYTSSKGAICSNTASDDNLKINTYKTREEAVKAYNKAIALEKIKRRIIELQGDWKPDWGNGDEEKVDISYYHYECVFEPGVVYFSQSFKDYPYIKSTEIALTIIKELKDELKLIFDIA
jgi:hypothetical protein